MSFDEIAKAFDRTCFVLLIAAVIMFVVFVKSWWRKRK
jgi:hypothetical protein